MFKPWKRPRPGRFRIAINRREIKGPYGGANQVLRQIVNHLRDAGHQVTFRLDENADCVFMYDARDAPGVTFPLATVRDYKTSHPEIPVVHRVNLSDRHKGGRDTDDFMRQANEVADHTIFISRWLLDYFAERWFERTSPHAVIFNGADPKVFHPDPSRSWRPAQPFRIVTHHWSDNWAKGFDLYQEVDAAIADGRLPGCELEVIGRWPAEIRWRSARTHKPVTGPRLGRLLRRNHLYLTGARFEGGGLHAVEGAQCGLPVVFHEDGGGLVEFARPIGIGYRDDVVGTILKARDDYSELRKKVLSLSWSGRTMCEAYERTLLEAVALHKAANRSEVTPRGGISAPRPVA